MATTSKLWMTDQFGSIYNLDLKSLIWRRTKTDASRNCFKKLAALKQCVWALGADQRLYMCVFKTDSPICVQASRYENQRWSPRHGFSNKGRITTDRPGWSDVTGQIELSDSNFEFNEYQWKWESDWYIDESLSDDVEGWQYALDFPATYYDKCGKLSFVRRRRWARYKQYIGFDRLFEVDGLDADQDPIQDIAVGSQTIAKQHDSSIACWVLTFSGKLLHRLNIHRNCPGGDTWKEIHLPDETPNIVQIAASPSGPLWAVTWDGIAVVRVGVSHLNPTGTAWRIVNPPTLNPQQKRITQIAVGEKSVWGLCDNGKIYFRKGITPTDACGYNINGVLGTGWVEMIGDYRSIAVSSNNQVFALAEDNNNVFYRSGIVNEDLVGKTWDPLYIASYSEATRTLERKHGQMEFLSEDKLLNGSCSHVQPMLDWSYISASACTCDGEYLNSLASRNDEAQNQRDATILKFRNEVLKLLQSRNLKEADPVYLGNEAADANMSKAWTKRAKCKMQDRILGKQWYDAHIKLRMCSSEFNNTLLLYYCDKNGEFVEMTLNLQEIKCICRIQAIGGCFTIGILTLKRSHRRNPILLDFEVEKEALDWCNSLDEERSRLIFGKVIPIVSKTALWATSIMGDIYFCNMTSSIDGSVDHVDRLSWHRIGGHMRTVKSGMLGVTWSLGYDGHVYIYDREIESIDLPGPKEKDKIKRREHQLYDHMDVYIYENHRWNPWEGFSASRLPSDRWIWSDETGLVNCDPSTYRLPAVNWQWDNEWIVDFSTPNGTDKEGWQYAVDFPRSYHKSKGVRDYVRRRRWKRRYRVDTKGPWFCLDSDVLLRSLSIQQQSAIGHNNDDNEGIALWAVGSNGNVLYRSNVTENFPQGTQWTHVPAKEPFTSIAVGTRKDVWGVAVDGATYLRAGFGNNKQIGTHWFHVGKDDIRMRHVSIGSDLVLGIDQQDTLWRRCNVSAVFPEGTEWSKVLDDVQSVSVDHSNKVWIVRGNDIETCFGSNLTDPLSGGLTCILSGCWKDICNQGCLPLVTVGEECLDDENKTILNSDEVTKKQEINPYAVDIYQFYDSNKNSRLSESDNCNSD